MHVASLSQAAPLIGVQVSHPQRRAIASELHSEHKHPILSHKASVAQVYSRARALKQRVE